MIQIVEVQKGEIVNVIQTYKSISIAIEMKARVKIEKLRQRVKYRNSSLIYIN
jgi:hypothetical protein